MKKGAVITAWTYSLHTVSYEVDKVTHDLYEDILGKYRPKEWMYIERRYVDIPFSFRQIDGPQFKIELQWNLPDLINYVYTWSSVQKFIEQNNSDPVKQIYDSLERAWGKEHVHQKKTIVWPIYTKIGRAE